MAFLIEFSLKYSILHDICLCGILLGDLNVSHDFECLHSELGSPLVLRMWAGNSSNQHPSANAQQWWPMSYNYQYQTQPAGKHSYHFYLVATRKRKKQFHMAFWEK